MSVHPDMTLAAAGLKMIFITSTTYAPQLARVKFAAFRDNDLNALLYPDCSSDGGSIIAWLEERERRELVSGKATIVAIVDTTKNDEVIACAKWKIPAKFSSSLLGDTQSVENKLLKEDLPAYPEGSNIPLQTRFRNILRQHRTRYYDPENDLILGSLYTHPAHQGRGCASLILQWGIEQADVNGANIYLESSPRAHSLYAKYGWRDVDRSIIDLSQFGGKGLYPLVIMIREGARRS